MKRIVIAVLCLFVCFSLSAKLSGIVSADPSVFISSYPLLSLGDNRHVSGSEEAGWFERAQDYYYRYFKLNGLLDLGLRLDDEHFSFVLDVDLRQTFTSFLKKRLYSNIPYVGNDLNAILDMNFPRTAYGEVSFDKFFLSVGRRPIGWGPGTYDFAIGDSVPFQDNIWFDYKTKAGNTSISYNFVAIGFNTEALDNDTPTEVMDNFETGQYDDIDEYRGIKTLLAHRVGFGWSNFRFSIGELNLIYGEYPNLVDANPFGIYHNLFQDRKSNVMGYLEIEGLIDLGDAGKLRVFGTFAMDDFDLPNEKEKKNGKPGAIGLSAGVQYHVFDGEESVVMSSNSEKYRLSSDSFRFKDGLNISYEFYFCSPYMYNRAVEEGKFTVPFKQYGSPTMREANAFFIGFQYGPNSMLHELRAEYSSGKLEVEVGVGLLLRGDAYGIESPYGIDYVKSDTNPDGIVDYDYRYKLYGDEIITVLATASAKWLYAPGFQLQASLNCAWDTTNERFAYEIGISNKIDFLGM